jgi:tetratricopeptide (TPR) repeat protein
MFKLKELSREDALHLMASQGWLELGNHLEANEELEQITPAFRVHPDVLLMRWQIYARAKQWEMCVEIGRALTELVPESPQAWVNYANSLYFDKRTQDAYDAAQQALKLHASSWTHGGGASIAHHSD